MAHLKMSVFICFSFHLKSDEIVYMTYLEYCFSEVTRTGC